MNTPGKEAVLRASVNSHTGGHGGRGRLISIAVWLRLEWEQRSYDVVQSSYCVAQFLEDVMGTWLV